MVQERRTILYSGRVQGVGFRWRALQALRDHAVAGYVRNLADGRVELVLEGAREDTVAAADAVRAAMARNIADEAATVGPPTGEFSDITIRR